MTAEEAIGFLEESKRQNEIMRENPNALFRVSDIASGVKNAQKRIDALDMAISTIRAEQERESSETMNGWISVKDGLPPPEVDVLVMCFYQERWQPLVCHLGRIYKDEWFTKVAGQRVEATHWMPLPKPPEEGTK